jgi:poly(ADP-ribose) glycohydrolase ARH3
MLVDLKSKYVGSMVGSAIGDAIGEVAFYYPGKESLYEMVNRLEKLVYTDDTTMAIGLAESLLQKKRNRPATPWRYLQPLFLS